MFSRSRIESVGKKKEERKKRAISKFIVALFVVSIIPPSPFLNYYHRVAK